MLRLLPISAGNSSYDGRPVRPSRSTGTWHLYMSSKVSSRHTSTLIAIDQETPARRQREKPDNLGADLVDVRHVYGHEEVIGGGQFLTAPDVPAAGSVLLWVPQAVDRAEVHCCERHAGLLVRSRVVG